MVGEPLEGAFSTTDRDTAVREMIEEMVVPHAQTPHGRQCNLPVGGVDAGDAKNCLGGYNATYGVLATLCVGSVSWHIRHMQPFAEVITDHLRRQNASPIREALNAGLNRDAIRSVLRGRVPSVERAAKICEALGLEFYVGPPREPPPGEAERAPPIPLAELERSTRDLVCLTANAGGDPIPDEIWPALAAARGVSLLPSNIVDPEALGIRVANEDNLPPGARSLGAVEFEVAAGGGAINLDEARVKGQVWFRRDWLDNHGLDPARCMVISVRGESMEPTLPDGCSILVDRQRTRRGDGRIFVIDTEDGLIVKRLGKEGRRWVLVSDHDAWPSEPWPAGAEPVGQVVWMARTLV